MAIMESMKGLEDETLIGLKNLLLSLVSTEEKPFDDAITNKLTQSDNSIAYYLFYILENEKDIKL